MTQASSLSDFIQAKGAPPEDVSIEIFRQIAHELCALHAANKTYPELDPQHILVSESGPAGYTAALAAPTVDRQNGLPEDDVTALGCCMYDVVTVRAIRPGEDRQTYLSLARGLEKLPQNKLSTVIRKALDKDKQKRFQSMTELSTALDDLGAESQPSYIRLRGLIIFLIGAFGTKYMAWDTLQAARHGAQSLHIFPGLIMLSNALMLVGLADLLLGKNFKFVDATTGKPNRGVGAAIFAVLVISGIAWWLWLEWQWSQLGYSR